MSDKVVSQISWDWKDCPDLEDLQDALEPFGIRVYRDPFTEGSDTYGFILSKEPLNKHELRKIGYGELYEEVFGKDGK